MSGLGSRTTAPLRVAYADPPYEGQAKKHYGAHQDFGGEVDHPALIEHLCDEFPDGWALSCKSNSLRSLLPLCPADCRVLIWAKTHGVIKKNVAPTYAWEPVIKRGGRNPWSENRFLKDWVELPPNLNTQRFAGAKPELFCLWLFECMGLQPEDEFVDLFPGTGGVMAAWTKFSTQTRLAV